MKKNATAIVFLVLLFVAVSNFMTIYNFRVNEGGNKIWLNGLTQIMDFLEENGASDSLVVFGTTDISTYLNLMNLVLIRGKFIDTHSYANAPKLSEDLRQWISRVLSKRSNVFFVFPAESYLNANPGMAFYATYPTAHENFLRAYGYPFPAKIIRNKKGVPLHYIYKFDKQWLTIKIVELKPGETTLSLESPHKIASWRMEGPAGVLKIKTGVDEWSRDLSFLTERMSFNFRNGETKEGVVEFYPDYSTKEKASANIFGPFDFKVVTEKDLSWLETKLEVFHPEYHWLEFPPANLKYLFYFPPAVKITQAEIRTNPRIKNDISLMNSFKASYSTDDRTYAPLYRIASNGNGRFSALDGIDGGGDKQNYPWSGFNESATYNVIYPQSNKVFINFCFINSFWSKSHVNLFAHNKTTFFKFNLDMGSYMGNIPLLVNNSQISFTGPKDSTLYLTLSANNNQVESRRAN